MRWILFFIKKPEEFVRKLNSRSAIILFISAMIVKIAYNIISDHSFPAEMNFEFAGISNPKLYEFILSYLISEFLFLGIFLSAFLINIRKKAIISLTIDILLVSILSFTLLSHSKIYIPLSLLATITALTFFISNMIKEYIISVKIMISLQIFNIISTILLYISEIISSNTLAITVLFVYSIISFAYFIKIFRAFYDISVKRLIISSIPPIIISVLCGFVIYKANIFSPNTVKLILYN